MNIEQVKRRNRIAGYHFFDADTMRFFSSRVHLDVYGDGYFVTSERFVTYYPEYRAEPRRFTVRRIEADGSIETVSDFQAYGSRSGAHAAAKRLSEVTS